jgi:Lactoylglutathione lyase and related lyases
MTEVAPGSLPGILGLFEAHLPVADLGSAIEFYADRLGLSLAYLHADRRVAFLWLGSPGGSMLGLWETSASPNRMTLHVAFRASREAVVGAPRALRAAGITPLDFDERPTDDPVVLGWMPAVAIYFRDPDGHLLEYLAMLDERSRPDLGVVSLADWRTLEGSSPWP